LFLVSDVVCDNNFSVFYVYSFLQSLLGDT